MTRAICKTRGLHGSIGLPHAREQLLLLEQQRHTTRGAHFEVHRNNYCFARTLCWRREPTRSRLAHRNVQQRTQQERQRQHGCGQDVAPNKQKQWWAACDRTAASAPWQLHGKQIAGLVGGTTTLAIHAAGHAAHWAVMPHAVTVRHREAGPRLAGVHPPCADTTHACTEPRRSSSWLPGGDLLSAPRTLYSCLLCCNPEDLWLLQPHCLRLRRGYRESRAVLVQRSRTGSHVAA